MAIKYRSKFVLNEDWDEKKDEDEKKDAELKEDDEVKDAEDKKELEEEDEDKEDLDLKLKEEDEEDGDEDKKLEEEDELEKTPTLKVSDLGLHEEDEAEDGDKKELEEEDEEEEPKKELEEEDDEEETKKELEEEDNEEEPKKELEEEDEEGAEDKKELDEEGNPITKDAKPGDKSAPDMKVPAGESKTEAEKEDEENKKAMNAIEKGLNVTEDVKALLGASNKKLSEEFKSKAKTIFESAVRSKVVNVARELNEHYNKQYKKAKARHYANLEEKIDSYFNYVIKEWMQDNKLAVERGLQVEAVESFIGGLKGLFAEHYIDVPEGKANLVEKLAQKVEKVEAALNEEINKNVKIVKELNSLKRKSIINKQCKDLSESQKIKIRDLAEKVDFESEEQFSNKVSVLKESYFPKKVKSGTKLDVLVEGGFKAPESDNDPMSAYGKAISRTIKK